MRGNQAGATNGQGWRAARLAVPLAMLAAASVGFVSPVGADGGGQPASCVSFFRLFSFDGDIIETDTRSTDPVEGYVVSASIEVADFGHPELVSEASERVTFSLGGTVIGTTRDLGDAERRVTLTFPVGQTISFDSVTVTHAPETEPDDVFVKRVCFELGEAPTSSSSTTDAPSSTTEAPTSTSEPSSSTSSTTTEAPTSTTEAPTSTSEMPTSTTEMPTSTTEAPTSSSTTVPGETTTSTPPTSVEPTVAPPTTVPGLGSFSAECVSGDSDVGSFIWTASGSVPDEVTVGTPIAITDQTWRVVIPDSVLENARQLGLVTFGTELDVVVGATITATGTEEGERSQSGIAGSVTVVDAGDGSAASATAIVGADDMTFTPTVDRVEFRLSAATLAVTFPSGEVVDIDCVFGPDQPPIVVTPPGDVTGPPPGELAITGPSPLLVAGIVIFVLFDIGYLAWSATRPRMAGPGVS